MFFTKKEQTYEIINRDVNIQGDTNAEKWANFAYYVLYNQTNDEIYSEIFSDYISLFMTGVDVSRGLETTYFTSQLDTCLVHLFDISSRKFNNVKDQKRYFFHTLCTLFCEREVKQYEKKVFRYTPVVHKETKQKFTFEDKSYSQVFSEVVCTAFDNRERGVQKHTLIFESEERVQLNLLLCYSDKLLFDTFEGSSAREQLQNVLEYIENW